MARARAGKDIEAEHRRILDVESGRAHEPPVGSDEERIASLVRSVRLVKGENVIKNHVMVALSFGLVPLPLLDVAVLTGNQVAMVRSLGAVYGQPFARSRAKASILSLIGGSVPVLGVLGLSTGAKLIPGVGTLVGSGGIAVGGGVMTYAVGRVFLRHYESGGTLLTFDAVKARAQLRREILRGRDVVSDLKARMAPAGRQAATGSPGAG